MRLQTSSTGRPNSKLQAGFSLIEISVTLLIVGVLAGVSVPRMNHMISDYRVDAAAARVMADLKYAGKHARIRGKSETMTFDTVTDRYSYSTIPHPDFPSSIYSVDLSGYPYKGDIAGAAFDGSSSVTFDGYGFPNASGNVTVSSGGVTRIIKLNRATGSVTVGSDLSI